MQTSDFNVIIGVHTGETEDKSYGTIFWDDKGLISIFGFEQLKAFMDKVPEYQTKSYEDDFKF